MSPNILRKPDSPGVTLWVYHKRITICFDDHFRGIAQLVVVDWSAWKGSGGRMEVRRVKQGPLWVESTPQRSPSVPLVKP